MREERGPDTAVTAHTGTLLLHSLRLLHGEHRVGRPEVLPLLQQGLAQLLHLLGVELEGVGEERRLGVTGGDGELRRGRQGAALVSLHGGGGPGLGGDQPGRQTFTLHLGEGEVVVTAG